MSKWTLLQEYTLFICRTVPVTALTWAMRPPRLLLFTPTTDSWYDLAWKLIFISRSHELCVPVASASGRQHIRSASMDLLQVSRAQTTIGQRSFAVAGPSLRNSRPAALWRAEMTAHFQETAEGLSVPHLMCCEPKKHLPPPGAVVAFAWFWRWIQNCRLTYLLNIE